MSMQRMPLRGRLRLGLVFLLLFNVANVAVRWVPKTAFWDGAYDGLRGALLGVAAALVLLGLREMDRSACTSWTQRLWPRS